MTPIEDLFQKTEEERVRLLNVLGEMAVVNRHLTENLDLVRKESERRNGVIANLHQQVEKLEKAIEPRLARAQRLLNALVINGLVVTRSSWIGGEEGPGMHFSYAVRKIRVAPTDGECLASHPTDPFAALDMAIEKVTGK